MKFRLVIPPAKMTKVFPLILKLAQVGFETANGNPVNFSQYLTSVFDWLKSYLSTTLDIALGVRPPTTMATLSSMATAHGPLENKIFKNLK